MRHLAAGLAFVLTAAVLVPPAAADARLEEARRYLDDSRPEEALQILDEVLKRSRKNAEALLLRSTGKVMLGDLQGGHEDLRQALKVDPRLRQGWLNLAGLEIAEGRYQEAYDALLEARKIDPAAVDNHLNLGAVLVMQGAWDRAAEHFEQYLGHTGETAEAHFLVAANYALFGRETEALVHLRRAIELDEGSRLRARSDSRFLGLGPRFEELLDTDHYRPPAGAHTAAVAFPVPYSAKDNRLLFAVLEALDRLGIAHDPAVETTPRWGLVRAEMRIKVHNQANGSGVVSLSAPAERFTDGQWQSRTEELLQTVHGILGQ
jgi:tetratricopeptide (TPR) repeat protein